ncbi:MAG: PilZ domain-containing protein [Deltaproteobacteria bacterium]|nr:PilZ domain-containing protein [Deltaproteobacteria bacterium]
MVLFTPEKKQFEIGQSVGTYISHNTASSPKSAEKLSQHYLNVSSFINTNNLESFDIVSKEVVIKDLSTIGAYIITQRLILSENAGLHLEFTLPQGFHLNTFCRVNRIEKISELNCVYGYGVQFCGLNDMNIDFLNYYLNLLENGQGSIVEHGRITLCYEVTTLDNNQLFISILGSLHPLESEDLEATVGRALAKLATGPILVFIDASVIGANSRASLEFIHNWLERLRHNRQVFGVMVGHESIGFVQFRRLAREAGIADSLISFTEHANAVSFWGTLIGNAGYLSTVA